MKRFPLELPANLLVTDESSKEKPLNLLTSNICAGGVFFKTEKPLTTGTELKIGLIIPLDELKNLKGKRSRIEVSGFVIRTDQQGMAICFEKRYKISPC